MGLLQEQIKAKRALIEGPSLISQVLAESQSKPKPRDMVVCRQCQGQVDDTGLETVATYGVCPACRAKRLAQKDKEVLRANRRARVLKIKAKVFQSVPKLFAGARMKDLSKGLRHLLRNNIGKNWLLWGAPGVGKSYAAAAFIRYEIARRKGEIEVARVQYERLSMEVRACFGQTATTTEQAVVNKYILPDLLVLEDVGCGRSLGAAETDFSVRMLLVILDARLEDCKQTIITTNKSWDSLKAAFDERVGSRLATFEVVELKGQDRRLHSTA